MTLDFAPHLDDPSVALALGLSLPPHASIESSRLFSVDTTENEIRFSIPRSTTGLRRSTQLMASKETIAASLLLRHLYETRFERNPEPIRRALSDFAKECYYRSCEFDRHLLRSQWSHNGPSWPQLFEYLQTDFSQIDEADELANEVFNYLENESLAVDPAITGTAGVMVLVGLIPVRWSVRTPKGQQVLREIKIHAGLWSLDIERRKRGDKIVTDWDFRLRGINVIKKLLRGFAEEYLEHEDNDRGTRGRPRLPPPDEVRVE